MTLTNSLNNVKPAQYITIAYCDTVGWYVVKHDDARMTRSYPKSVGSRVFAIAEAIKLAQKIGWKLVIV